jgi:hypothetical protein
MNIQELDHRFTDLFAEAEPTLVWSKPGTSEFLDPTGRNEAS